MKAALSRRFLVVAALTLCAGLAQAQHARPGPGGGGGAGGPGRHAGAVGPGWHGGGRVARPGPRYVAPGWPRASVAPYGWRGPAYDGARRGGYRPWGPRWSLVLPPIGFVAPVVPYGWRGVESGADVLPADGGYGVASPAGLALALAPPAAPDPIFYPREGQSPAQTETDRRACNRWATTQPDAMAVASVFQRATLACMDGRGYTVK